MEVKYFGVQDEKFDYSEYEFKLKNITSVTLNNITDLQSNEIQGIENSFKKVSEAYFKQIADLLKEISEEL